MRLVSKVLSVFILSVILVLGAAPPASAATTDFTLPNGLKVILIENHRAPVASMLVWVKAGSGSERENEHGMAHLFEHMLFKGTARRGPGEIAREIEASGGDINAYTSYDQTVYYVDIAARYAEKGLDVLADMVFHPAFDPVEFEREKEVVIEELRRGEDNPDSRLSEATFKTAYRVHPYGRPVIGFVESVQGFSREGAVAFHQRWYRPGNMVLVAAGDFDTAATRAFIEKTFGAEPAGQVPEDVRPVEPPQTETRVSLLRQQVQSGALQMGFHVPEAKSKDIVALDLLGMVLGEGRTSRLYREVKRNRELVHTIATGVYSPRDPGLFVISARLEPENAPATLEAILAQIAQLRKNGVSDEEMARNKLAMQAAFIHSRTTMSGEARVAASFEVLEGDYRAKDQYLDEVEKLTSEDLRQVAGKYLRPENLTVTLSLPEAAEPDLKEASLVDAVNRGAAAPVKAAEENGPRTGFADFRLKNGARLLVKEEHSLPLVSVRAAFLGGLRYESPDKAGLNNMLAEVWDRGTARFSPEELARETEDMAAVVSSFSGRNSFGLEAEFLSRYLDRGLALFAEVLTSPALDPAEVDKARPVILAELKRRSDQSTAQAFRLYAEALYDGHPYGRDTLGTPETVASLTAGDLRDFYEKYAQPDNLVMAVVGDVDAGRLRDRLDELLASWDGRAAAPPAIAEPKTWEGVKEASERVDRRQTHLVVGFPAPGLESPDRYALEVLDAVLSGQGGRLFIRLRDEQSLAYSVSSFYSPGLGIGSFGLYIAGEPSKEDQAKAGFDEVMKGLMDQPITPGELRGAKEYILGRYEIGLQKYEAQAAETAFDVLYGLGLDYPAQYEAGIEAVTAQDVQRVARSIFGGPRSVRVVVGPENGAN